MSVATVTAAPTVAHLKDAIQTGDIPKMTQILNDHPEWANQELEFSGPKAFPAFVLAMKSSDDVLRAFLIRTKATLDISKIDSRGDTLLHHAVFHGNRFATKFLLSKGADLGFCDKAGKTPLEAAPAQIRESREKLIQECEANKYVSKK